MPRDANSNAAFNLAAGFRAEPACVLLATLTDTISIVGVCELVLLDPSLVARVQFPVLALRHDSCAGALESCCCIDVIRRLSR